MKAVISRDSHRPDRRYSGVFHIQGAMITDADLDERSVITRERTDNLGDEMVKDGVPAEGGAVAIADDGTVSLVEGVIYADGVRGVLAAADGAAPSGPLDIFTQQADLPLGPALPATGDVVVYADIWERPVFALEDPYLADAGLHGAVTGYRSRTMTQLKAAPAAGRADIEGGSGAFPQIGTGRLAVTPLNAEILADECDPCADVVSAEQQVANALWRLEIISIEGTPDNPTGVVIAWSEENAAEIAPASVSAETFERTNKVYEYFSPITEARAGVYANAGDARLPAFVDDLSTTPAPPKDYDGEDWPFVRRWDGTATIDTSAGTVTGTRGGGFDISVTGGKITLRVTAFKAEIDFANASVVPGDYWLVEMRRHAPETERIRLVSETPLGILHHYCTLFTVSGGAIAPLSDAERRKLTFPALPDLPADHVGFVNTCEKLYGDAENVQEALDNLCSISADDIGFRSNCPPLYDDATTVQEALDALCRIDFSVQDSFRLLFDWGVVCGIVPRLTKQFSGLIAISPGSYLDRAGRITRFEGGEFDLSKLEFGGGKGIEFENVGDLNAAFREDGVCLALASGEGGKTTIHVIPEKDAYGPDDPSFSERVRACVERKKIVNLDDVLANLPDRQKAVATKLFLASTADGAFRSTARLTGAEFADSASFIGELVNAFGTVATDEETALLNQRIEKARRDNPTGDARGTTLEIRQMQQATAGFAAFTETDQERLQRCICDNLFPPCPPDLGEPPFYVPIACLHGGYDPPGGFFLREVCAFCCRKQAMTWRALQYFIGDMRTRLAAQFAKICCAQEDEAVKPGLVYDPQRFATLDLVRFSEDYKLVNTFLDRPDKLPSDFVTKVTVKELSTADATKALADTGLEVEQTVDINDAKAFDIIQEKLTGIEPKDLLMWDGEIRPGDKVALLVQEGVARGYVLVERGSGRLPFETAKAGGLGAADIKRAEELVTRAEAVKGDFGVLEKTRDDLLADIEKLRAEAGDLEKQRDDTAKALATARDEIGGLVKAREALSEQIASASKDLSAIEENYGKLVNSLRDTQPVNAVLGNDRPELVAALAGEGVTTVGQFAKLKAAAIRRLERSGAFREGEGTSLRDRAADFLKR